MKGQPCFGQLLAAQRCLLRSWTLLGVTLGIVALPLAAAWLAAVRILTPGQLLAAYQQLDERLLPLWALVAAGIVWGEADTPHRQLLLTWPAWSWKLVLAKALAVGLGYALLAGVAAVGLPALYVRATGVALPVHALPPTLLLWRAILPAAVLVGATGLGCALGSPWAGLAVGSALWLANLLGGGASLLDRYTAGALNLFAWTRGSCLALGQANVHTALAALILHAAALSAPRAARCSLWRWLPG